MEKPQKKKKTFLGVLMRIFMVFVLLLAISIGLFFWKKKDVTAWSLHQYSLMLTTTMTSEKYYQIKEDQEYKIVSEGTKGEASFDEKKLVEDILSSRKKDMNEALDQLVTSYEKDNLQKDWLTIFTEIRKNIQEMFTDNKVTSEEYELFLSKVNGYSK